MDKINSEWWIDHANMFWKERDKKKKVRCLFIAKILKFFGR